MKEIRFVDAEDLKTNEDYITALLTGMASLKTLYAYHLCALDKGLLQKEDELKLAESIRFGIDSLLRLYKAQVENMLDKSEVTQDEIMDAFRARMPNVKIPRKKKTVKKEKKDEVPNLS